MKLKTLKLAQNTPWLRTAPRAVDCRSVVMLLETLETLRKHEIEELTVLSSSQVQDMLYYISDISVLHYITLYYFILHYIMLLCYIILYFNPGGVFFIWSYCQLFHFLTELFQNEPGYFTLGPGYFMFVYGMLTRTCVLRFYIKLRGEGYKLSWVIGFKLQQGLVISHKSKQISCCNFAIPITYRLL